MPDTSGLPSPVAARSHRDLWTSLLLGLLCLAIYNANLRSISAGDSYPARYLPFAIWRYHTVLLDPILTITAQGRPLTQQGQPSEAFWIVRGRGGHALSLYPVVLPLVISPLYLPAVVYLHYAHTEGWDEARLDRVARIMEKLSASLLAAIAVALLYLLLRRRAATRTALLLTLAFAFGTTTWVISSQALWQHGLGELLVVAMLWLLTGPCTTFRAIAAGLLCGLLACNRPPDAILAAAFAIYGLWWARRLAPLLAAAAAVPAGLLLIYNIQAAGSVLGAYGLSGKASFLEHDPLTGVAGLLFSPTKGLFVFSPFLLFLPFGWRRVLRDRGAARGLTVALGIAVVLQLLLYAKADWRQGFSWGPRWLTDVLPILLWMLPPVVAALRGAGRVVFVASCCLATAIQVVGAFWYTGATDAKIYAVAGGSKLMRAAWDFRNAPFIAELRHEPAPAELATSLRGSFDSLSTAAGETRDVARGDQLYAAGWALASGHSPREIVVLVDGWPTASIGAFSPRPDVSRALGAASPSGWRIEVPTNALLPGEHVASALAQAYPGGDLRFLAQRRFTVLAQPDREARERAIEAARSAAHARNGDLALSARLAEAMIAGDQQAPGYWLTSFTAKPRFEHPGVEMNTFLTSMMIDVLGPVAAPAGLGESIEHARRHLSAQIETEGLVRYHGRPDAPTIGTLGCAITPDADDTALVWRIAPEYPERLPMALATLGQYRTPEGLYRTWLAPRDQYQCIDPGKDPNPADVGIQMHVLMLLAEADPPAAHMLCRALERAIIQDDHWVYYHISPLVPILRQADLKRAGCPLELPKARLQTMVPGQAEWIAAGQLLQRLLGAGGPPPRPEEVTGLLRSLSRDEFAPPGQSPPLAYHNDLTASVPRFYWSADLGYALWLRLYFENERHRSAIPCRTEDKRAPCGPN